MRGWPLTLIQFFGVRMDPAVIKTVTLLELYHDFVYTIQLEQRSKCSGVCMDPHIRMKVKVRSPPTRCLPEKQFAKDRSLNFREVLFCHLLLTSVLPFFGHSVAF